MRRGLWSGRLKVLELLLYLSFLFCFLVVLQKVRNLHLLSSGTENPSISVTGKAVSTLNSIERILISRFLASVIIKRY